jgi:hypothetical protein
MWRDPRRLNWAEVATNDYSTWKFVSKIHGPNASASANIKDALRSGGSRCLEELTIQRQLNVQLGKWQRCSLECDATESRVSRTRKSVVLPAHGCSSVRESISAVQLTFAPPVVHDCSWEMWAAERNWYADIA